MTRNKMGKLKRQRDAPHLRDRPIIRYFAKLDACFWIQSSIRYSFCRDFEL